MRVLAISGSFKKISFNTMVLGYLTKVFAHEHEEVSIEFADISKLPLFCEDIENDENPEVKNFRDLVRGSDAIIICTPEHNYSYVKSINS
jgi:NAD(P)H-dependent FMN reductase